MMRFVILHTFKFALSFKSFFVFFINYFYSAKDALHVL